VIVIDASALVAVVFGESASGAMLSVLQRGVALRMSPINQVEARMIVERRGLVRVLDELVAESGVEIIPIDAAQAEIAWAAFKRFGKGRHAAALNLADCFAYALAQISEAPLLYIGADFAKTDMRSALAT
jgi:ribonuclease VapC